MLDEVANIRFDTPSKVIAAIEQTIAKRVAEAKENFDRVTNAAGRTAQGVHRSIDAADTSVQGAALRHLALAREQAGEKLAAIRAGSLKSVKDASERVRDAHPLTERMHKPDPKLAPDKQGKRSVVPIQLEDVDQWLYGTQAEAKELIRLAPVEVFDAGPLSR